MKTSQTESTAGVVSLLVTTQELGGGLTGVGRVIAEDGWTPEWTNKGGLMSLTVNNNHLKKMTKITRTGNTRITIGTILISIKSLEANGISAH